MTLRTPRRRISPRTKRRYRAIREFFRRALGSSSQPDLKISSSIALNVTDLKRKIVGLEQQLDEVNRHCKDITCFDCSRQESESCLRSEARNVRESESSNPSEGQHLRELDSCNPSEGKFVRNSNSYILADVKNEIDTIEEQTETSYERKLNGTETKFLYKSSDGNYIKSEESENICNIQDAIDAKQTQGLLDEYGRHITKVKNKKNKLNRSNDHSAKLHKYKARSVYDNIVSANSTSSFRSLAEPRMVRSGSPGYSGPHKDRNYLPEYAEPAPSRTHKDKKYRELMKRNKIELQKEYYEPRPLKARKHKHQNRELDQDFIADIIRRQYKPVKMYDRRQSDLSQISAPICRDQEFPSIREDIQEGTELCSCCYDVTKHKTKYNDLSEMRSICDTRLYSSKKQARGRRRRVPMEVYDNSDLYDLIPVKEKCSPKTRRKFVEDTMIPYEYYREVPPSPRTLRPKLNLKAQYNTEFEDYMTHMKHAAKKGSPHKQRRRRERLEVESDITSVVDQKLTKRQLLKTHKNMTCQVENDDLCQRDNATAVSLQYPTYTNDQANATIETAFNKTDVIEMPVDKTDKALCEIKDILQNFLHEIKKETTPSQCDKSEISSKDENCENNNINENSTKITGSRMPNSRHSINYSVGCNQSPYMTPFQNPCCYPMMQMCPMNCPISMQSGFMIPSQSYTCTNCVNASKEPVHSEHCCNKNVTTTGTCHTETCHTETEELIKEIYKFVAQSPNRKKETDWNEARNVGTKILTSRSVGESSKISKHDAKVGTAPLKCYSKSCEAIGSRNGSDEYTSETNPTYSDTLLEKFSLEATQSTIDTEMEDIITTEGKDKKKKFSNVLRSFGMFKKKKKDVIEELSESESAVGVPVQPMPPRAPYQQEMITNYMMQDPEYYRPPPPMTSYYPRPHEYHPDYHPPYNPGLPEYQPPQPLHDYYGPRMPYPGMAEQASAPPLHPKERPTAPPYHSTYDNPYKPMQQPQVPLCLKEIEVKSIATQSERKMSIFRKIKKKMKLPQLQPPPQPMPQSSDDDNYQKTCSTQTQVAETKFAPVTKPLFNWKKLQAKAMGNQSEVDTMKNFTALAQKELADNDLKMRNVMMKKLFNKRNPFSPKNLMVQTLLGRDKNYIEPPVMFKPKLFL